VRFTLLVFLLALSLSGAFSAYVYLNVTSDVTDIGNHLAIGVDKQTDTDHVQHQQQDNTQQFIQGTKSSVLNSLVRADLALLTFVTLLGYYLSGLLLRPIEQANRAHRAFATNASHELRTPLAILRSDTERLARNAYRKPEAAREIAVSNLEELSRMERITSTLLSLVRLGSSASKTETLPLDKILREEMEPFMKLARERDVTLTYKGDSTLSVRAVPGIGMAFRNVMQNALAYTPRGGSVRIVTSQEDSSVRITIEDTGQGIAPRDLPHVFEPFYKGENSGGSGLGLPLVKELVERSDGSIHLTSTLGSGTHIEVVLPCA